eukprot:TRINITY_DN11895_c0_g1_i1.p2 TRINITY_DN11895_c0_g1~~TRINITY_DN11895_c0_g1_i1.p2  ORF type:complete len:163 (+),score=18.72 TRINITY_DN11895_c0_g1_i1:1-489(+)
MFLDVCYGLLLFSLNLAILLLLDFFFFFSSRRRHTRCREVSWARRCVQETAPNHPDYPAGVQQIDLVHPLRINILQYFRNLLQIRQLKIGQASSFEICKAHIIFHFSFHHPLSLFQNINNYIRHFFIPQIAWIHKSQTIQHHWPPIDVLPMYSALILSLIHI